MFDRVVKGGLIICDDYGVFPGETKAVDEFLLDKDLLLDKSRDQPCDLRDFIISKYFEFFVQTIPPSPEVI